MYWFIEQRKTSLSCKGQRYESKLRLLNRFNREMTWERESLIFAFLLQMDEMEDEQWDEVEFGAEEFWHKGNNIESIKKECDWYGTVYTFQLAMLRKITYVDVESLWTRFRTVLRQGVPRGKWLCCTVLQAYSRLALNNAFADCLSSGDQARQGCLISRW